MELAHRSLLDLISTYTLLDAAARIKVVTAFEHISVSKNILLEQEAKKTQYLYYVHSGYVRVFYVDDGVDRTTQINCPSRFITSFQSFITNGIAYDNVETITDCELLRINKKDLDALSLSIPHWGIFGEKIYEQALVFNEERTRDMILLNAEERYLKLIQQYADIIQNVPLQYIASYIGIKPESLSRIRKQLIS